MSSVIESKIMKMTYGIKKVFEKGYGWDLTSLFEIGKIS